MTGVWAFVWDAAVGVLAGVGLYQTVYTLTERVRAMANTKKLSDYIAAGKREPFRLDTGEHVVEIPCPTSSDVVEATANQDNPEYALRHICGVAFDEIWDNIRDEEFTVMNSLLEDVIAHFTGGKPPAKSPGSSKQSTDTAKT